MGDPSGFLGKNVESLGLLDVIYLEARRVAPTIGMEHAFYPLPD